MSYREIFLHRHSFRWFRMVLWLGPVVALCGWVGSAALPSGAADEQGGPQCSASSVAVRTAQARPGLLRKVRINPGEPVQTVPGMPPVLDTANLYSGTAPDRLSPTVDGEASRIYVPNRRSNSVSVIDPATLAIVDRFPVGPSPQHVVPSWDLKTLWVANNGARRSSGSLTPIDPKTGKPGSAIPVDDPYNLYFTPDGKSAIVVAERHKRLDFRDPQTMALQQSIDAPSCSGINHADFSINGRYAIFTCEFRGGGLAKIDLVNRKVLSYLRFPRRGMPQDIRISPDGSRFYVADMHADGVYVVDGDSFIETDFIPTGIGTHGLYPSRDGKELYVANRGSHSTRGAPHGKGSIAVLDFATGKVEHIWPIPGGGSPDMGNVSVDGKQLWLSGRFDNVVYDIDTTSGSVKTVPVGQEPHGLTVWPQPGRYSLGHTGNMR
jgi:YVTN family beta-propeller protein